MSRFAGNPNTIVNVSLVADQRFPCFSGCTVVENGDESVNMKKFEI